MTLSMLIPILRGWLALAVGFAVAVIVPPLIPAYDGPGVSSFQMVIAALTAAVAAFICTRSFQSRRVADRVVAFLAAAFSVWMFYVFIRRVV